MPTRVDSMHRLRLTCSIVSLTLLGCSSSSPGLADEAATATATGTPLGDATASAAADPALELRPAGVGRQLAPSDQEAAPIAGVETPWPRVLPCEVFAEVTFEVFDAGGTLPAEPREVVWRTDAGGALPFRAARSGPAQVAVASAVGPGFPGRALSRLEVPGRAVAEDALVNVWLRCEDTDGAGIEWVCKGGRPCDLGVVYPPRSAPQWPAALEAEGALADRIEGLITRRGKRDELGQAARAALASIIGELAISARAWLDVACAQGRCPTRIADAAAQLTRFIEAPASKVMAGRLASPGLVRITRAEVRQVLDNEHYRAGYPRLEVEAEAGAETVSLTWERPEDWRLSFGGSGPDRVTCSWDGCAVGEVSVGSTLAFHFYHPNGFGVRGPPLEPRPDAEGPPLAPGR